MGNAPLKTLVRHGAGPRAQIASDGISVVMTIDAQYDGFYGYFMRFWMDLAMPTGALWSCARNSHNSGMRNIKKQDLTGLFFAITPENIHKSE